MSAHTASTAATRLGAVLLTATLRETPSMVGVWLEQDTLTAAASAAAHHPGAEPAYRVLTEHARDRRGTRADLVDIMRAAVRTTAWAGGGPAAPPHGLPAPGDGDVAAAVAAADWPFEAAAHVSTIVSAVRLLLHLPQYRSGPARALVEAVAAADGTALIRAVARLREHPEALRAPLLGQAGKRALEALPPTPADSAADDDPDLPRWAQDAGTEDVDAAVAAAGLPAADEWPSTLREPVTEILRRAATKEALDTPGDDLDLNALGGDLDGAADLAALDTLISDHLAPDTDLAVRQVLRAFADAIGQETPARLNAAMAAVADLDPDARARAWSTAGERLWQQVHPASDRGREADHQPGKPERPRPTGYTAALEKAGLSQAAVDQVQRDEDDWEGRAGAVILDHPALTTAVARLLAVAAPLLGSRKLGAGKTHEALDHLRAVVVAGNRSTIGTALEGVLALNPSRAPLTKHPRLADVLRGLRSAYHDQ
ncbi:hypothetical protein [Nocardiopsis alborubida]|uniref:Uncharacterized protein n=1 Tax=Nocardiopsis alborubida TaxID=146802 RepID=A0A7X6RNJ7_9ACTN|nr:hypothetical protein [Nocardiopsis alborubida]NKY96774.1 hypothetical protein [Nocardiopsis alborubida]